LRGLRDGVAVKFHRIELDDRLLFICQLPQIPQSKIALLSLELIVTIEGGFCYDIALLFCGTALKIITGLIFEIAIISSVR